MPDHRAADLRAPAVLAALAGLGLPRVEVLDEVGSTNEHLAAAARRDGRSAGHPWPDLSLVVAGHQSAGRGRLDRVWSTEPGTALTFSLLLRPAGDRGHPVATEHFPWLTLLMAAAVVEAVDGLAGVQGRIKWPNDVLVGGRKLAGLLAALVPDGRHPPAVVLGTGVNVSQQELPVQTATSVRLAAGRDVGRAAALQAVLSAFVPLYQQFCADPAGATGPEGSLRRLVTGRMETLGRSVRAELPGRRAHLTGTAAGLGAHGGLLLRDPAGRVQEVTAGDVVHLRPAPDPAGRS